MLEIIENKSNLKLTVWENYGKKRIYINRSLEERLAHDLYFDLNEVKIRLKSTNKEVKIIKQEGWEIEKINENEYKVYFCRLQNKYFIVKF